MNKIEKLAKILFLFFAVISFGLLTVSCSDDSLSTDDINRILVGTWISSNTQIVDMDTMTLTKDGQVYSTAKIFDGTYFVENDSIMTIGNRSHIKYRLNIDVLKGEIELRLYNRSILTEGGYYVYIYKKVN